MSTIFGAWRLNKKQFQPNTIEQVVRETSWWNPDKKGLYHQQEIFLGHQLLATQPEQEKEKQPYKKASLHIVADVRLDNRVALKKQLGDSHLITDYQLILAAYQKYGTKCVQHFIGAFAFVIWDEKKQQFFGARDQMGIKPFNYYFKEGLFVFGTQKKSILALEGVNRSPNWRNILNKLSNFTVPPNSTPYEYIQILAPAHNFTLNVAGLKLERYWDFDIHKRTIYKKKEEYVAHFNELFQLAIRDRMIHAKGVGAHLSGGLDSSGITSVGHKIAQQKGYPFHAFSYSVPRDFKSKNMDLVEENLLAFDLVDYVQLKHFHNIYTQIQTDFKSMVEGEALVCDGPSQSTNVFTEYELQAKMRDQKVDVALSGFPGDELVTSFCYVYYLEYLERGNLWDYFFKKITTKHRLTERLKVLASARAMQYMPNVTLGISKNLYNYRGRKIPYAGNGWIINKNYFNEQPELKKYLKKEFFPDIQYPKSFKEYQRNYVCRPHTSKRIESETLAGLRFKVEYRYPMTDIRLLQYVLSIPIEQKLSSTMTRYIFRRAMKEYLPDSIRLRDMKFKGSLKTTHLVNPINIAEDSKFALWENIKNTNSAPFMNQDLVEKYMKSKRSPYNLFDWMVLGQLGVQGRFSF